MSNNYSWPTNNDTERLGSWAKSYRFHVTIAVTIAEYIGTIAVWG